MNLPGRYHRVCAVFKTMLNSYCHENCGLFYVDTHLHIHSLSLTFDILCVKFSFVAFASRIIRISGLLSPESNQRTASPLVTVKKPRINNIRFSAIGLFQLYDLHVIKQHDPVILAAVAYAVTLSVRGFVCCTRSFTDLKCKKISPDPVPSHIQTLG